MHKKPLILLFFMIFALSACSSRTACQLAMCNNQTGMQMDYTEHRDQCRALAELKAGMRSMEGEDLSVDQKTQLVGFFSECMNTRGWNIPTPGEDKKAAASKEPDKIHGTEPLATPTSATPEMRAKRSAECSFARNQAPYSLAARQRAQACDIECENMRRIAPEAPPAPSCP